MIRVLVPLAQGCEELEAITITDLMVRAGFEVITAGLDEKPVIAARGMQLVPSVQLSEVIGKDFDIIILPGGLPGANHLRDDANVQRILKKHADENKYIGAICAAPKALVEAGVVNGKTITCFPGALDGVKLNDTQLKTTPIEIDGKIVTSRGPGTAMDFTLILIELLAGKEKRLEVEAGLQR